MLATESTFLGNVIADKLYVDVNVNPKFALDLIFRCDVLEYSCNDDDIAYVRDRFGDLYELKYYASTTVVCEDSVRRRRRNLLQNTMDITVTITLEDYIEIKNISTSAPLSSYIDAMQSILTDIGDITSAIYESQLEHTSLYMHYKYL